MNEESKNEKTEDTAEPQQDDTPEAVDSADPSEEESSELSSDESGEPDVMLGMPPSEGNSTPDVQATEISDPAPAPVFETAPMEDNGFWEVPLGEDWVQEPPDTTPRTEHEPSSSPSKRTTSRGLRATDCRPLS